MRVVVGVVCLGFLVWPGGAWAARQHREVWYQQQWCAAQGGRTEVAQPDGTRVDCVTESHAVEFDFADKWAEALGQSLHYARLTGLRAGVVLILEVAADDRYRQRLAGNVGHFGLPIDLWVMGAGAASGTPLLGAEDRHRIEAGGLPAGVEGSQVGQQERTEGEAAVEGPLWVN